VILGAAGGRLDPAAAAPDFVRQQSIPDVYRRPWGVLGLDLPDLTAVDGATWLVLTGNPLLDATPATATSPSRATRLLADLNARGVAALGGVDGVFAMAWFDGGTLHLLRDRFGAEPFFYAHRGTSLAFGSRARDVVAGAGIRKELSSEGLAEYLTYAYIPGTRTLYAGVERVPAGGHVRFEAATGKLRVDHWYRLSYAAPLMRDEEEIKRGYRERLEAAVVRRLGTGRAGTFLSGGMDSSSAVTFARRHTQDPIQSFGFRCSGNSFDESHYARALAQELGVQHHEVDYGEEQALSILDAIGQMEVPFSDIGIEIGTWILSRSAASKVDYILTGDGGDEIWASHPVYAAQRMLKRYDSLPRLLRQALVLPTRLVRDSDKKRNFAVVAKRLLPDPSLGADLGHFRWRTYFTRQALRGVVTDELAARIADYDTYQVVRDSLEGYEGPDDNLSPWMYSDYTTASGFYFSRLLFTRGFGFEVRLPFFDRELVEFGARIPAELKLEGVERTKRLFRESMEGVLPNVINHRKDKLGHSVPLKNWLRDAHVLGEQVAQTLRSPQFQARRILRPEAVERLLNEHATRRDNHSHRLWGFFVLEHWLRRNFD
jgi:asparagine synthase (glutamine-hydrolysing)